jgi:hypothetical protein
VLADSQEAHTLCRLLFVQHHKLKCCGQSQTRLRIPYSNQAPKPNKRRRPIHHAEELVRARVKLKKILRRVEKADKLNQTLRSKA